MTAAIWLTPAGDLGIIPELEYYELDLDAYNEGGGPLTYSVISGSLPPGLQLESTGTINGIPLNNEIAGVPEAVTKTVTSTFTVRVTNSTGDVTDRTFNITVAGILPPIIVPESSSLGTYVSGMYVDIQLTTIEPSNLLTPRFSLLSGELPIGLTLTSSGRIYGYINPTPTPEGGDDPGFDATEFDRYAFDFSGSTINKNFQFSVQADDGAGIDVNSYTIYVYDRATITADSAAFTADDDSLITADTSSLYSPILYTEAGSIGNIRQDTNFAFHFDAVDFDDSALTYAVTSGSLPTGLSLNATSGWLTGLVPYGSLGSITYNFTVQVYKTASPSFTSENKSFSIKVIGQVDDTVVWSSPSDLGRIYNGSISDLFVAATTPSGKNLRYRLISTGTLPVGLKLLDDGTISGRVSFEAFASDGDHLTYDGGATSFDLTYTFTVAAYDSNNLVYDEKEFTITVIQRDDQPYENLYVQLLPSRAQRAYYDDIINNNDIFTPEDIYRINDPWYGKNTARRSLFMTGLNPLEVADYISAMTLNHYWKTINFGSAKFAQALDENFNVKYEVVYVEMIDRGVNSQGLGPNIAVSLPTNSQSISTIYPNSFPNMVQRMADGVGYQNRSILPGWMTSRQPNGTVLGFTRAMVLCYTNPGRGAEIAYRVNQVVRDLSFIDFTIDRYEWDSALSDNFLKQPLLGTGYITTSTDSNVVTGSQATFDPCTNSYIGTSTIFSYELFPGKTLYVSNVFVGNVATITNNHSLTLTTNAAGAYSSSAFSYSSNVFAINNFVIATGNITANTQSNIITGESTNISGTGNITCNISSTSVIGLGTLFTTELRVGKTLYYANAAIGVVASIIRANLLTLADPPPSTLTNVAFTATGTSTLFARELLVGDSIVTTISNANVVLGTVSTIVSNNEIILFSNAVSNVANVSYYHTDRTPYTVPGQGDVYLKFPQVGVLS